MPQQRLPMRKIRDVLRLTASGMSSRKVAASLSVGGTTVRGLGIAWPQTSLFPSIWSCPTGTIRASPPTLLTYSSGVGPACAHWVLKALSAITSRHARSRGRSRLEPSPSMPEPRHTRPSPLAQAFAGFRFFGNCQRQLTWLRLCPKGARQSLSFRLQGAGGRRGSSESWSSSS